MDCIKRGCKNLITFCLGIYINYFYPEPRRIGKNHYVEYTFRGGKYKHLIKSHQPKNKPVYILSDDKDVTSDVLPFFGPNCLEHFSPRDIGYTSLKFVMLKGPDLVFTERELMNFD